jgi:hypothetical protein
MRNDSCVVTISVLFASNVHPSTLSLKALAFRSISSGENKTLSLKDLLLIALFNWFWAVLVNKSIFSIFSVKLHTCVTAIAPAVGDETRLRDAAAPVH